MKLQVLGVTLVTFVHIQIDALPCTDADIEKQKDVNNWRDVAVSQRMCSDAAGGGKGVFELDKEIMCAIPECQTYSNKFVEASQQLDDCEYPNGMTFYQTLLFDTDCPTSITTAQRQCLKENKKIYWDIFIPNQPDNHTWRTACHDSLMQIEWGSITTYHDHKDAYCALATCYERDMFYAKAYDEQLNNDCEVADGVTFRQLLGTEDVCSRYSVPKDQRKTEKRPGFSSACAGGFTEAYHVWRVEKDDSKPCDTLLGLDDCALPNGLSFRESLFYDYRCPKPSTITAAQRTCFKKSEKIHHEMMENLNSTVKAAMTDCSSKTSRNRQFSDMAEKIESICSVPSCIIVGKAIGEALDNENNEAKSCEVADGITFQQHLGKYDVCNLFSEPKESTLITTNNGNSSESKSGSTTLNGDSGSKSTTNEDSSDSSNAESIYPGVLALALAALVRSMLV